MKLQQLSGFASVLFGLTSLACSAPDDDIFMGNDDHGGSGGSSSGSSSGGQEVGGGAGMASGGKSQGSAGGGGSSGEGGKGGTAAAGSPSGGTGPVPWDPCAGKACGDFCQLCDPEDANCVEPAIAVQMSCTSTGECSAGNPACTVPKCDGVQKYYALGCDGASPIAFPLFTPGCYDSCTDADAKTCADGYTCTRVWHDPSAGCAPGGACIAACGAEALICIAD